MQRDLLRSGRPAKSGSPGLLICRAGRQSTALASALIVHEEEAKFFGADRAAEAGAEDVLFDGGTRLARGVEKILVGVELVVAKIFVSIAVKAAWSRTSEWR